MGSRCRRGEGAFKGANRSRRGICRKKEAAGGDFYDRSSEDSLHQSPGNRTGPYDRDSGRAFRRDGRSPRSQYDVRRQRRGRREPRCQAPAVERRQDRSGNSGKCDVGGHRRAAGFIRSAAGRVLLCSGSAHGQQCAAAQVDPHHTG